MEKRHILELERMVARMRMLDKSKELHKELSGIETFVNKERFLDESASELEVTTKKVGGRETGVAGLNKEKLIVLVQAHLNKEEGVLEIDLPQKVVNLCRGFISLQVNMDEEEDSEGTPRTT